MSLVVRINPFTLGGVTFAGEDVTVPASAITRIGIDKTSGDVVQAEATGPFDAGTMWLVTVTTNATTVTQAVEHDPEAQPFDDSGIALVVDAARIRADFSNAEAADRASFQTSVTDGNTILQVVPNGTGVVGGATFANAEDPTDASVLNVSCNATQARVTSNKNGVGAYLPLVFAAGGADRVTVKVDGTVELTSDMAFHVHAATANSTNYEIPDTTTTPTAGLQVYFTVPSASAGDPPSLIGGWGGITATLDSGNYVFPGFFEAGVLYRMTFVDSTHAYVERVRGRPVWIAITSFVAGTSWTLPDGATTGLLQVRTAVGAFLLVSDVLAGGASTAGPETTLSTAAGTITTARAVFDAASKVVKVKQRVLTVATGVVVETDLSMTGVSILM